MVQINEDGTFNFGEQVAPTQVKKKAAATAKKFFQVPDSSKIPADYKPPEYRTILGRDRIGLDVEGQDPNLKDKGPGARRLAVEKELGAGLVGVAISYGPEDAEYYPTRHEYEGANVENPDQFWNRMRDEAKEFDGEMVGANLQYDLDWMAAEHGVKFPKAKFRDVQIAEPLLNENRMSYALNVLAKDYLKAEKSDRDLIALYGEGYIENMARVHPAHAAIYGEGDVTLPWQILDKQQKKLEAEGLSDLYDMESALTPLLLEMRERGVRIDLDKAERGIEMTERETNKTRESINQLAQANVDIWSSDSIAVAFDNLGLEYPRTKTGKPSFVKAWLENHAHEISDLIVTARGFDKIGSTFIQNYLLNSHVNGRVHCMFNPLRSDEGGTVSGRFSSSGPNLQNIPARHPILGPLLRSMFIPEEGMLWGSLDWSQIEYRLLVHYASISPGIDAEKAVAMYIRDALTDFHDMAAALTGLPRKQAKNINFGVVYGMGIPKLAASLGVSLDEAAEIMAQFHGEAPFIKGMLDLASNRAAALGEIRTILGRKRRFTTYEVQYYNAVEEKIERAYKEQGKELDDFVAEMGKSVRGRPRRAFTHKALNSLLQGSAADLMKKAMVEMWEAGIFNVLIPHLTVHDEFNSSVPDTKEGHEAFNEMRHIMQTTLELKIPVLADGSLGANWDEAK